MGDLNTGTAGPAGFPKTRWTMIREARDPSIPTYRDALELFARIYWRPVYAHFLRKWNKPHEEAKDLTQEFFATLLDKSFLKNVSSSHGRFRSYVMAALDNFARLKHRDEGRIKRGGGAKHFSLQIDEEFEPSTSTPPDQALLREWAATVLSEALEEMKRECKASGQETAFQLLMMRDVDPPREVDLSYEGLAKRFGISATDVTNLLYKARQKLREMVLGKVRDTTTTEEEAEQEMRELFAGRES